MYNGVLGVLNHSNVNFKYTQPSTPKRYFHTTN
ncbi:hypothetical protein barba126A_phanotate68 [Rheinheimera phage vB_RspM_barba_12-6A]|uniref:Uncharacterized protein n=31 Tax=Barbavirus barba18A TaxID=2734090 RepID=A0A7G9VRT2_9CAUD|nr:hypothetical protein barba13A_phanotate19 [Rheinheimera phage vB_RspM_barba_1-3A]QNO01633.1 hypothetical protein barba108A_phanotate122 [Rheinheimera phage vB_RspM_barba_10-8A]QNO01760.1 hypothetical protein barba108B_phanotate89 [Rheinheimera phage vB_RspM_barba_10-8B]QNO01954.1 hypothetical protein barba108D_phanotate123 [Rheinheimera phage vB_RspM_barba_10-8D]QNO02011.1 hypothetical protein barba109A_phanotate19 [Rheinheimera phage vB_RspM_barba_10-9A]QNO02177.1 hypothetical protein barb